MLNKVILQGNIGHDPKIFLTQDGREIASFSLATTTSWKDKSGEWHSSTDWHGIVVFRKSTIRWIKDILKRGDSVYVEGKLTYQQRTDGYGQTHFIARVVVSGVEGKVQHLKSSQSSSQESNLISEKEQSSSASRTKNVFPTLDLPKRNSFSDQPCPPISADELKGKDPRKPYPQEETTYES